MITNPNPSTQEELRGRDNQPKGITTEHKVRAMHYPCTEHYPLTHPHSTHTHTRPHTRVRSQLSVVLSDHDELLSEHDTLTGRHDSLLQEAQTTRERLTLRVREVESAYNRESVEQRGLVEQLRHEIEELTTAFTNQITGLQQEHKKVGVVY